MKKKTILFLILFVLIATIPIPYLYGQSREVQINEANELLVLLDKEPIADFLFDGWSINAYGEILRSESLINNISAMEKEKTEIEEKGKKVLNEYFDRLDSEFPEINTRVVKEEARNYVFEDYKNINSRMIDIKEGVRAEIDKIPNLYYEINPIEFNLNTSFEEKVGMLFSFTINSTSVSQDEMVNLANNYISSASLFGNNVASESQLKSLSDSLQFNPKYPTFLAVDQEGGIVKRLTWDLTGSHKQIADESEDEQCESWKAREQALIDSGVNWNLGVIGDVTSDPNSFIFPRVFSGDFEVASNSVKTAVDCTEKTIQTLKHWPGHGGTGVDTHTNLGYLNISEVEWLEKDNRPFQAAIDSDVSSVMVGHLILDWLTGDKPASLSKDAIDYLRDDLGFENMVVTDDLMMLVASGTKFEDAVREALLAGHDHLFIVKSNPEDWKKAIDIARELVDSGEITMEDLNSRVERIIKQKNRLILNMYRYVPWELVH